MEKVQLIFIPSPLMGHIGQLVELAKFMLDRFDHLSISVLVMKLPTDPIGTNYTESISSSPSASNRIRFHHLPPPNPNPDWSNMTAGNLADLIIELHKPDVRDIVRQLMGESSPSRLAAFVVDMFCTSMIDVGKEFGVPSFVFFTSNAAFLGLMLHFQSLHDEHGKDVSELKNSVTELVIPSYATPVSPSVLPLVLTDKRYWSNRFLRYSRKYREAKGIIVNTFFELESHALGSYDAQTPPVYAVGPMLKTAPPVSPDNEILRWLDCQPESSVVFMCFGSMGCFNADQVKEIATGLERSGCRFLWSLRKPLAAGMKAFPVEFEDPSEILPDGFSERTAEIGKVIGWAPQMAVLSHNAVGGFVSHCGWNSILESIRCGVPIATWPLYAEQQIDAFQIVKELGLGIEITLDYEQSNSNQAIVVAEAIEEGIRTVLEGNSEVRRRVKEMREKSRMAVEEGGSSYTCLQRLVGDLI